MRKRDNPQATRHVLGVFPFDREILPKDYVEDQVDGFTVHSLWPAPVAPQQETAVLSAVARWWPSKDARHTSSNLSGDYRGEFLLDFQVISFPAATAWLELVEKTLKAIVEEGAAVAFIAAEWNCPEWPSGFLSKDGMSALEVYAAYSKETGFLCQSGLDDEIAYLTREEAERLNVVLEWSGILEQLRAEQQEWLEQL